MIANIRIRDSGHSRLLCQLDLMRFSEEQIRERMRERGIRDDTFFICGFMDWDVDSEMSLTLAYALKRCMQELYDGDETIVVHLLKRHIPVTQIISHYYRLVSKDEVQTVIYLLKRDNLLKDILTDYIDCGALLNTEKGFYVADN